MRNVKTGRLAEYRFRVDEEVTPVRVEEKVLQYLYQDGENFMCMDPETFDQIPIHESLLGERKVYLKDGMNVTVSFEGDLPLSADPPTFVELEITYSEPAVKGDTVNNVMKPATLETGTEVRVPAFVNVGDRIKVDTRTGEYVERVK
jgi:elongation factor P